MPFRPVNAADGPVASGGYAQAALVEEPRRLLFISGQIPEADGTVPEGFEAQCRLVWRHVEAQLRAAGMGLDDLVKVTIFLRDRAYRDANSQIRQEILGARSPALTVVIADTYEPNWLLEIEAVAAA